MAKCGRMASSLSSLGGGNRGPGLKVAKTSYLGGWRRRVLSP